MLAQQSTTPPTTGSDKKFALAPLPIVGATLDRGAGVAVLYQYQVDKKDQVSPLSGSGIGGFATGNGSWGVGALQRFYLKEDRFRAVLAAGLADVNYDYFGIGTDAGKAGASTPIDQRSYGLSGELLYRVGGLWYAGPRYNLIKTKVGFENDPPTNETLFIPQVGEKVRNASLGPRVERDSRSDTNYPRAGSLFEATIRFYGKAVAGQLSFQTYQISYSKYFTLAPRQVLAVRGAGCYVNGNAPFYDLCLLAVSENLRGYEPSRYRDRRLLVSQAEYRLELWKRLGAVAFGGVGEVGRTFGDFSYGGLRPGGGVGLRFRLTRESHLNLRTDYAWGKGDSEFYVYIGEAF